jgi:arylsulfatase A-like enzyme
MLTSHLQSKTLVAVFFLLIIAGVSGCKKELKKLEVNEAEQKASASASTRPNIILFLANDFGYEIPTFTGGKSYSTPTLDMMAANGIFFSHAYSHPDGFPSRLAFYTGKYNFRNYITWGNFSYSEKTIGNMLSDAGYATCFVGKWQMNGGDYGLHSRGWQKYRVFLPFQTGVGQRVGRYKNPIIYENAAYLPDSATLGKYSEDMFSDYLCNFIDTNKSTSFIGVYSFNLAAEPYVPTPDDPAFATWNTYNEINHENTKYFPGMVNYLDKMIAKILNKLQADGIAKKTICMFLAPTATQSKIVSIWGPDNTPIEGHKLETNMWGTLTPLTVYWPGHISPHRDRATLIDFTDFLPTIADLTGTPRPTTYGTLDGVSFADNIKGTSGEDRNWVFCHWDNDPGGTEFPLERFVNDSTYKLYDTLNYSRFYNIVKDTFETKPIPNYKLTPVERKRKQQFIRVLQKMHL